MELLFEIGEIKVWSSRLIASPGEKMRDAEHRIAGEMAEQLFGRGARISHSADGAPFVEGVRARISVSHGGGLVIIAAAPECIQIGVDVETEREQLKRVANRFVCVGDNRRLSLLELWTAKEAAFKAAGVSTLVISEIAVNSAEDGGTVAWLPDGRRLRIEYHPAGENLMVALAWSEGESL